MDNNKEKKGFNFKLYAILVITVLSAIIILLTVFTFRSKYIAYSPEKVAVSFVGGIAQNGDGYNAFKQTLVSKNQKYGDFITNAYMLPYINEDAAKAEFVGTGSDEEIKRSDELYGRMYDYFLTLISGKGFDDFDAFFTAYFEKLAETRKEIYGDDYMDKDFMFSVLESNVDTYGKSLTGSNEVLAADGKTVLAEATKGFYQEKYGDDYKFNVEAVVTETLDESAVKEYVSAYKERIAPLAEGGEERAGKFGFIAEQDERFFKMIGAFSKLDCSEQITDVKKLAVNVATEKEEEVETDSKQLETIASIELYVVKIGSSWYVDQSNVNTAELYAK